MQNIEENQKYGKLTILSICPSYKSINKTTGKQSSARRFLTKCDCGKERIVKRRYLLTNSEPCCCKCAFGKRPQSLKRQDKYIRIYKMLIASAKKRSKTCLIDFDDFKKIIIKDCYYCNEPPKLLKWEKKFEIFVNGIDRLNNNIGYELHNCVPCCAICNTMKMCLNVDDFYSHIKKISNRILKNNRE